MCPELGKPGARWNTPSEFLSRQMPPVKVSICSLTATTSSISIFPGTPAGWNSGMAASIGNGKSGCSASATGTLLVIIWWPIWIVRPCEFSVLAELDYPIVEVVGQLSNQMFLHDPPCNLAVGMHKQMASVARMVKHQCVFPFVKACDAAIPRIDERWPRRIKIDKISRCCRIFRQSSEMEHELPHRSIFSERNRS